MHFCYEVLQIWKLVEKSNEKFYNFDYYPILF